MVPTELRKNIIYNNKIAKNLFLDFCPKTVQSVKKILTTFHDDFHSANVDHLPVQAGYHHRRLEV